METIYKEGTILLVAALSDSGTLGDIKSIKSVSVCEDKTNLESYKQEHEPYKFQNFFVINCFNQLDEDYIFMNNFIFDKKEVKPGDKVYVVIGAYHDDLGEYILGVFTEEIDKETFFKKYVEDWNSNFDEDYNQIGYDSGYISKVFEVVVS